MPDKGIASLEELGRQTATLAKWLRLMGEAGMPPDTLQRMIDGPDLRKRVASMATWRFKGPSQSVLEARELGLDVFGPEEIYRYWGILFNQAELEQISEVPFSRETLTDDPTRTQLILVPSISIVEMAVCQRNEFCEGPFTRDRGKPEWHLLYRWPYPGSHGKVWEDAHKLVDQSREAVASVRVLAFAMCSHLSRGRHGPFCQGADYLLCAEQWEDGSHAMIGYQRRFPEVPFLKSYSARGEDETVGLATEFKPDL